MVKSFQITMRDAALKNNSRAMVVFKFTLDDYFDRSNHKNSLFFLILDKLTGMVTLNAVPWTVLHEVAHHLLGHTSQTYTTLAVSRRQELDADAWAFAKMIDLGYSLFEVDAYLKAGVTAEDIFSALETPRREEDSTIPNEGRAMLR